MKVFKETLQNYGLFNSLPDEFKNLSVGEYFVFYYTNKEEQLKLEIYESSIVNNVNVSLYRGVGAKIQKYQATDLKVAFFSGQSYETRDGIFYLFLRTFNTEEAVATFYSDMLEQDKSVALNIATGAVTDVYNSDDFRRAISYFVANRIQAIMFIYDMVASAIKSKASMDLYGGMINKVVSLIKYDGGVLNEINGSLRYMVLGERANLSEEQRASLAEAKMLLRSQNNPMEIYKKTGWMFGDGDGKWRTNISDEQAAILEDNLYDFRDRKLYKPIQSNLSDEDYLKIINQPSIIYSLGYTGKLSEVLYHPTLYQYYPNLANIPIVYFVSDDENNSSIPQMFYQASSARGSYIVIIGSHLYGSVLSTLLHETQHAVQRIEDFARGGNEFFAKFVASIGGKSVRKVFAGINKMEQLFKDNLLNDATRISLLDLIKRENPTSNDAAATLGMLKDNLSDRDRYLNNYKEINFAILIYISQNKDVANNDIVIYLSEKLGDVIFDLLENITASYSEAMLVVSKLTKEGFRDEDIHRILFAAYENLYGEMESRSVQASRFVTSEYKNYFYLTEWERSPIKQLVVIDGVETVIDTKDIKAAVEKKEEDYVMHFSKGYSCVPFLHELGHIVFDVMVSLGHLPEIEALYANNYNFENVDEFFVSRFLGYLKKNFADMEGITSDMRSDFSIGDDAAINTLLDSFLAQPQVFDDRLDYLQTILSIVP